MIDDVIHKGISPDNLQIIRKRYIYNINYYALAVCALIRKLNSTGIIIDDIMEIFLNVFLNFGAEYFI